MKENTKAFTYGTEVVDSPFGEGGKAIITLIRSEGMGDEDFEEYLKTCNKACEECYIQKERHCTTFIKVEGSMRGAETAIADGFYDHAQTLMKTHNAPCIQNRKQ
jgi:hypothetical protein